MRYEGNVEESDKRVKLHKPNCERAEHSILFEAQEHCTTVRVFF